MAANSESTMRSLLDMDLTRFSELAPLLTPQNVNTQQNNGDAGSHFEISASEGNGSGSGIEQQLHKMVEDQPQQKQELKENLQQMTKEITTHTEKVTKPLTDLFHEQQKQKVKDMDKQLEYVRTQFNASLGWRLKHHHTDLLKDLYSAVTPMSETITQLQEELSHCKETIHTLSQKITTAKVTTTFGHASVQTNSEGILEEKPQHIVNRPRLQSTIRPCMSEYNFGSPGESIIHGELKGRFMGKNPVQLQFPTFGGPNDTSDPLQYLERCEDFLALNPLTEEELIATLRNVLHGRR